MRKWALLLAIILALGACMGCGSNEYGILYYDLTQNFSNLDPQFATSTDAQTVIYNAFEGLLRQSATGELFPAAAEHYTVSDDQLIYTFTLRDNMEWSNGDPVVADDFLFAFERMFSTQARSPFASDWICIKNAQQILSGTASPDTLGVRAPDERTLIFELESPNPLFPELLCSSSAMPCNRSFFESTKARYGAAREFLCSNGPFYVRTWDKERKTLSLRTNTHYHALDQVQSSGVTFYMGQEDPVGRFLDGITDGAVVSYDAVSQLGNLRATYQTFDNTIWCLIFHTEKDGLKNALVRKALAVATNRTALQEQLATNYTITGNFVTEDCILLDTSYRTMVGDAEQLVYDGTVANILYQAGLREEGLEQLPRTTLMVLNEGEYAAYMGYLQQSWQADLAAYINLDPVEEDDFWSRLESGDFTAALVPVSVDSPSPHALLSKFASGASANYARLASTAYDTLLSQALSCGEIQEMADYLLEAENLLLESGAAIPLFTETAYYAAAKDAPITFTPFAGKIYFY